VLSWNRGAELTFGYEAAEIAGRSVVTLSHAGPDSPQVHEFFAALNRGETVEREAMARRRDGTPIHIAYTAFPIRDDHGAIQAGGMIARDVTEQRRLQEQLRQAQKMEAVGQLAGGIAHDFNNLLTVITGYGQLARTLIGSGTGASELEAIERAAERATELTRQLLAFSRRQRLDPVVLDLSAVARGLAPMLRRLIGDDIEVELRLADDLPEVLADAGQLEQVVINLAVNARDAMPEGGTLRVETGARDDDVWLAVTDTGVGIAPEALPHVFEPFYTTKPVGAGTGLGLASVHGAITQSGGRVELESEPGRGTTFTVLLPATDAQRDGAAPERAPSEDWLGGDETILVCEDEEGVRALVELVLAGAGYRVLSEGRPSAALERAAGEPGHIHGLVTDVIMPDMPGPELARRLGGTRPGMRTLFISGYTADTVRERGSLPPGSAFLEKPFDRATLLRTLRELLAT
jgi:PAS domain S-box-containing protein